MKSFPGRFLLTKESMANLKKSQDSDVSGYFFRNEQKLIINTLSVDRALKVQVRDKAIFHYHITKMTNLEVLKDKKKEQNDVDKGSTANSRALPKKENRSFDIAQYMRQCMEHYSGEAGREKEMAINPQYRQYAIVNDGFYKWLATRPFSLAACSLARRSSRRRTISRCSAREGKSNSSARISFSPRPTLVAPRCFLRN